MESNFQITINSLQHYVYCPRRWGLLVIEGLWADNYKTVQGNIVHGLVDDPFFNEQRNGKRIVRSLPIYLDEFEIYGVADCVEFIPHQEGARVEPLKGKYNIVVVEYKNGKPNNDNTINYPDSIQLAAQMMCIDSVFGCHCKGYVFYHTTGRRVEIADTEVLFMEVEKIVKIMNELIKTKTIPPKPAKQQCNNCSMSNVCMPKISIKQTHQDRIMQMWRNDFEKAT